MQTPDIIALIIGSLIALSLWKLHRDPESSLNVFDLIMENGRLSRMACVFIAAFLVSSWVMVRVALDGKMTDSYLLGYGGVFVAPIIAKLFSLPQPPGTTRITETLEKTVEQTKPEKPAKIKK